MENFMSILPRRFHPSGGSSPQFTRRHYVWLTSAMRNILSNAKVCTTNPQWNDTCRGITIRNIKEFADILAAENPRFNKDQFLHNVFDPDQSLESK